MRVPTSMLQQGLLKMHSADELERVGFFETVKALWAAGAIAVLAFMVNSVVPIASWTASHTQIIHWTYKELTYCGAISLFVLYGLAQLVNRILRRHRTVTGRENAMSANVTLISKRLKRTTQLLRSTRLTHWKLSDNSPGKLSFRSVLTQKIALGFPVRQLWQIKDDADLQRLLHYLDEYAMHDNYSVKAIVTDKVLIPEILCVGNDSGSLSLPEANSQRQMARAFFFFGRSEVDSLISYFDVLWELATPIKIANHVSSDGLKAIKRALALSQA